MDSNLPATTPKLELEDVMKYINGEVLDETRVAYFHRLLSGFKNNLSGFIGMTAYKQMNRLAKLLDRLEQIEDKIYSSDTIDSSSSEMLYSMAINIQNNVVTTLSFLMGILQMSEQRNTLPKNMKLGQVSEGAIPGGGTREIMDKDSRDRVRTVLNKLQGVTNNT